MLRYTTDANASKKHMLNRAKKKMMSFAATFTGCIESDVSGKSYGSKRVPHTKSDMDDIATKIDAMENPNIKYDIHDLSEFGDDLPSAHVMQIKGLISKQLSQRMFEEVNAIPYEVTDHQMWNHGKLCNKNARCNGNLGDIRQKGDIANEDPEQRVPTVWHFDDFPAFKEAREILASFGQENMQNMLCELNFYFPGGGIGSHGDRERNMVIGVSGGAKRQLQFRWWHRNKPISPLISLCLNPGDIYIMCGKASGNDWKLSSIPTLRHRADCGDGKFLDKEDATVQKRGEKRNWDDATMRRVRRKK